jgi:preprotein translocase subunit SecE
MSNQRVVNFAYVTSVALLWYVLAKVLDQVWVAFELPDQALAGPINYPVLVAGVLTGLIFALVRRDARVNQFLLECVREIREIVWPTRQEVIDSTKVVIVATLFLAAVLGGFDLIWAKVSRFILS